MQKWEEDFQWAKFWIIFLVKMRERTQSSIAIRHQPEQPQPQPHSGHLILKERGVRSAQAVRTERQTYCASTARNISAKNTLKVSLFATHASKHTHIHMHVLARRDFYCFFLFFFTSFETSNWFLLVWFAWLVVVCLTLQIYILCYDLCSIAEKNTFLPFSWSKYIWVEIDP